MADPRGAAAALETTADALANCGTNNRGPVRAAASPVLEELDAEACRRLLAGGGIGRVVFTGESDGAAREPRPLGGRCRLPHHHSSRDSWAVERHATTVGFEVDHVDEALAEGWSVLIRIRAHPVCDERELADVRGLEIEPWAGGERSLYVQVVASELTGRRIRDRH